MGTITINRDEKTALSLAISDPANGLAAVRVTWAVALVAGGPRALRKVGGLPGSTADIIITTQTAGLIVGTINIAAADFAYLPEEKYTASLWIDDGVDAPRCVTKDGTDLLVIERTVSRLA